MLILFKRTLWWWSIFVGIYDNCRIIWICFVHHLVFTFFDGYSSQQYKITENSIFHSLVLGIWNFVHKNFLLYLCTCVFIARQQRNYLAHLIRKPDTSTLKQLVFNNNKSKKQGRKISLYKTVIENEKTTPDLFNRNAIDRLY